MNVLYLISIFSLIIGTALLLISLWYYFKKQKVFSASLKTTATVTALRKTESSTTISTDPDQDLVFREDENIHKGFAYAPVVQFTSADGVSIEITANGSNPPRYKTGDRVQVIYPKLKPEQAVIDHWLDKWFVLVIMLGFGSMLTAFGGLYFLLVN